MYNGDKERNESRIGNIQIWSFNINLLSIKGAQSYF